MTVLALVESQKITANIEAILIVIDVSNLNNKFQKKNKFHNASEIFNFLILCI